MLSNILGKYNAQHVRDLKKYGFKKSQVFRICGKTFCGREYPEYIVKYGFDFIESFRTYSEAVKFRNNLWNAA